MFWGCQIAPGKDHTLTPSQEEDKFEEESKMLHISNASLSTSKKTEAGSKFKVFCQVNDNKYVIANLKEGDTENYNLDLYFKQDEQATFSVAGKGNVSVHLTGYWETAPDLMDDDYGMGPLEMDMDEEEDIELDPETKQNLDIANANSKRNALADLEDDEDDSDDDEDEAIAAALVKKAPAVKVTTKETVKVTKAAPQLEDSDDESDEDAPQPIGVPIAEDSDDDSDEAPVLVGAKAGKKASKQAVFDEEDSEGDSDEMDFQAILANKKRKPEQTAANPAQKKQKIGENKGKNVEKGKGDHSKKHQNKFNQNKQDGFKNNNKKRNNKKRNNKNKK